MATSVWPNLIVPVGFEDAAGDCVVFGAGELAGVVLHELRTMAAIATIAKTSAPNLDCLFKMFLLP